MKVGDLVSLSAAGKKASSNGVISGMYGRATGSCAPAHYGMVVEIKHWGPDTPAKPTYLVRWFDVNGKSFSYVSKRYHYRYELKKFRIKA